MPIERNLLLVHTEEWQDLADFLSIKAHVEQMAPDIEVFIASNHTRSTIARKKAASRPCLVFSPVRLLTFKPTRGQLYAGQPMSKLTEMQRLLSAGLPVPPFEELRPDTVLSADVYGPHVVVKPSYELASWGQGISLHRRENVRYQAPSEYPESHPGRHGPMIVQKFIDCDYAMTCRVLTLFGVPIFSLLRESTVPLALNDRDEPFEQADFMPTPPHTVVQVTRDPQMLAFAASVYEAMPDIALQACDILRDKTGKLHILEINPGGGTWMFSSRNAPNYRSKLGLDDLAAPFDALRTCARILIERTRAEAI